MRTELSDHFPNLSITSIGAGARLPTPLDVRPDIGKDLGVNFLIKREDLIDDLGSGHKLRKLGFVIPDILQAKADILVTGGSLPSGQCVAVASIASYLGLKSHLVYGGDEQQKPLLPTGPYLFALLLGSKVTWNERVPWTQMTQSLMDVASIERQSGATPYVIPPGISSWPGILGSIDLGLELADQLLHVVKDNPKVHIVAPAGSGVTVLGLSIAARLLDAPWLVHGVRIGGSLGTVERKLSSMRTEAGRILKTDAVRAAEVHIQNQSVGDGYDQPTLGELEAIHRLMLRYRLPLDPNYMIKTFIGLNEMISSGSIRAGETVVLVHTGGNNGLFGSTPLMQSWYRDQFRAHLADRGGAQ